MGFYPYLYFDGNCREAFTRYQEIFGGELIIMDGNGAPPEAGIPEDKRDLVMHAGLKSGDDLIMASDSYEEHFTPASGTYVHFATTDLERAKSIFAGLSDGGEVRIPAREEFWTPYYGAVVDRFGVPWQISVDGEAEPD